MDQEAHEAHDEEHERREAIELESKRHRKAAESQPVHRRREIAVSAENE